MNKKLSKGDLDLIEVVEHIDDPKKYAIMGRFKGSKTKHVLARVGEGEGDVRSNEMIKLTAECVAKEIISIYSTQAFIRARSIEVPEADNGSD